MQSQTCDLRIHPILMFETSDYSNAGLTTASHRPCAQAVRQSNGVPHQKLGLSTTENSCNLAIKMEID